MISVYIEVMTWICILLTLKGLHGAIKQLQSSWVIWAVAIMILTMVALKVLRYQGHIQ